MIKINTDNKQEACQILNQVGIRYPDAPIVSIANNQMQTLECS
jgi:TolA-binding protein